MIQGLAIGAALKRVPSWAWIAIAVVLLFVAWRVERDRYGDKREREGVEETDAKWKAASDKLIADAQAAGTKADKAAAARAADYAAKVEDERERIADAQAEGRSPFDEMFGG